MAFWVLVGLALSAEAEQEAGRTSVAAQARPQAVAPPQSIDLSEAVTIDDVQITARRGAAKVPPVVELDGAQIDAIGAWDIGEVLKHLDDIYGGQGEPLVLINGRRVPLSSMFNSFPPDAAVRVEVLPPEAAALYGGRAGQAVYNLVLQPRYASIDVGGAVTAPTQGGTASERVNAQRSGIAGNNSQQLRLNLSHDSGLRHADRDVRDANGNREDPRVSLRPQSLSVDGGGSLMRNLGDWGLMLSGNARAGESRSTVRASDRLYDNTNTNQSVNLNAGVNGKLAGWQINASAMANLNRSEQKGFSDNQSDNRMLGLNLTANRSLWTLPTGELTASVTAGANQSWLDSEGAGRTQSTSSDSQNLRGSITLPLVKAGEGMFGRLGGLQADFALGQQVSNGTAGSDQSISLAWQPKPKIRLNLSLTESLMGGIEALRNMPVTYGAPRTVYDFRRGEAVEILPVLGGNPALTAPRQEGANLSLSAGPFTSWQVSTSLNLGRSESFNGVGNLGELTDEVQSVFPDRFVRDADGRLIEVDFRPFNTGRQQTENLGGNINLNLPAARLWPSLVPDKTTVALRMGYNRTLTSVRQLLPGLPEHDSLKGDGGGVSPQDVRLAMDVRLNSFNANLNLHWREGYRSRRIPGVDGPDDLVRSDTTDTNLRLAWQIRPTAPPPAATDGTAPPRRRAAGSELSLDITNLFDTRPEVRLGSGAEAPGYGRDRQDPMGRTVTLNLRHRF